MLSTVKLKYPHPDGSIGIFPWLADLPSLLQRGLYADVVLHPMKFDKNSSGKKLKKYTSNQHYSTNYTPFDNS